MLFHFEHILLSWGLKTISDSEPLLNFPFNTSWKLTEVSHILKTAFRSTCKARRRLYIPYSTAILHAVLWLYSTQICLSPLLFVLNLLFHYFWYLWTITCQTEWHQCILQEAILIYVNWNSAESYFVKMDLYIHAILSYDLNDECIKGSGSQLQSQNVRLDKK